MSSLQIILYIFSINLLVWGIIYYRLFIIRKIMNEQHSQKNIIFAPGYGYFQGSINRFVDIKSNVVIMMTDEEIIFTKPIGKEVSIKLTDITDVRIDKIFMMSYKSGKRFLIIGLNGNVEIGFIVKTLTNGSQK